MKKEMEKKGVFAMWITHPTAGREPGLFAFRLPFSLAALPQTATVRVSADVKYRLYVNGALAAFGPCKRGEYDTYYDTVELAPYLQTGENELLAYVLCLPDNYGYYMTLIRSGLAAFMLEGAAGDCDLTTDARWQVARCTEFAFAPYSHGVMAGEFEQIDYRRLSREYLSAQTVEPAYTAAPYNVYGESFRWRLSPRAIPPLTYQLSPLPALPDLSAGGEAVWDAGCEMTGALRLRVSGTPGTVITLTYAECYAQYNPADGSFAKAVRDDPAAGVIDGPGDRLILDGSERVFETFWLRTFRFIRVTVEGSARIEEAQVAGMYYPLTPEATFTSSDPDAAAMWEVSLRTLRCCMHDSFEDCPYFEQMQYAMDTRLQMLYQRQLSPDRALIRKGLRDFQESRRPDGLTLSRAPTARKQRIPGFALHYIFMIRDWMRYDGDPAFVRELMPTVEGILDWFADRMQNGIVGPCGAWSYVDWVKGWGYGLPSADRALSVYNFMYICALEDAADLAAFAGRPQPADGWRARAAALRTAAREAFYDPACRYFANTDRGGFSLHPQVWAVLADVVTGDEARDLLIRATDDKNLPPCSYSMMFFVFRALEKAGLYPRAYQLLDGWRTMLRKHCTTWVEDDVTERSECHAWGALPIYEFAVGILGVRPEADATARIAVRPLPAPVAQAEGTVSTSRGRVSVRREEKDGTFTLWVKSEATVPVTVYLPDGTAHEPDGEGTFTCRV